MCAFMRRNVVGKEILCQHLPSRPSLLPMLTKDKGVRKIGKHFSITVCNCTLLYSIINPIPTDYCWVRGCWRKTYTTMCTYIFHVKLPFWHKRRKSGIFCLHRLQFFFSNLTSETLFSTYQDVRKEMLNRR